jgi:proteasome assembly chaperone (PAC2) family protein
MSDRSEHFTVEALPRLRAPAFIAAFKGWNDAAESASSAVQFLVKEWSAARIASLDPEEFYDFTEVRPRVRLVDGLHRELEWPSLELFAHTDKALARDVVLLVGYEPQLRWRTFTGQLLGLLERLHVEQAILLGSLLADVPHTRAPRLVGTASDEGARTRLDEMGVGTSRYEGPTGIVGVVQHACAERHISTISLWGNVPHYITASPNPQVCAALLQRLDSYLELGLNLKSLDIQAKRFRSRVDEAIAQSPEATQYVRDLEEREEEPQMTTDRSSLPSGPEVVRALEEFLRQQRGDEDDD